MNFLKTPFAIACCLIALMTGCRSSSAPKNLPADEFPAGGAAPSSVGTPGTGTGLP
ncbi:MAG: hypothetical protein ABIQ35_04045 [Verrucomicrobiota bacterium]